MTDTKEVHRYLVYFSFFISHKRQPPLHKCINKMQKNTGKIGNHRDYHYLQGNNVSKTVLEYYIPG